jgi:ASC-1-like (ASCH) protein
MKNTLFYRRLSSVVVGGMWGGAASAGLYGAAYTEKIQSDHLSFLHKHQSLLRERVVKSGLMEEEGNNVDSDYSMCSVMESDKELENSETISQLSEDSSGVQNDSQLASSLSSFIRELDLPDFESAPKENETIAVMETLFTAPAFAPLLPKALQNLTPEQKSDFLLDVFSRVTCPDEADAPERKEASEKQKQRNLYSNLPLCYIKPHEPTKEEMEWERLVSKYRCNLCCDVTCCPMNLTACSHSYCYDCLDDLLKKHANPICPDCRRAYEGHSYVRAFCNSIHGDVEEIADNELPAKVAWLKRYNRFHKMLRKDPMAWKSLGQEDERKTFMVELAEECLLYMDFKEKWASLLAGIVSFLIVCGAAGAAPRLVKFISGKE